MQVICAWCTRVIKPEDGTGGLDSHGICPACKDSFYPSPGGQGNGEKHRRDACATGEGSHE